MSNKTILSGFAIMLLGLLVFIWHQLLTSDEVLEVPVVDESVSLRQETRMVESDLAENSYDLNTETLETNKETVLTMPQKEIMSNAKPNQVKEAKNSEAIKITRQTPTYYQTYFPTRFKQYIQFLYANEKSNPDLKDFGCSVFIKEKTLNLVTLLNYDCRSSMCVFKIGHNSSNPFDSIIPFARRLNTSGLFERVIYETKDLNEAIVVGFYLKGRDALNISLSKFLEGEMKATVLPEYNINNWNLKSLDDNACFQ